MDTNKAIIEIVQKEDRLVILSGNDVFSERFSICFFGDSLDFKKKNDCYEMKYNQIKDLIAEERSGQLSIEREVICSEEDFNQVKERVKEYAQIEIEGKLFITYKEKMTADKYEISVNELKPISLIEEELVIYPYISLVRDVRFNINKNIGRKQYVTGTKLNRIKMHGQKAQLEQIIKVQNVTVESVKLQLKSRNTASIVEIPVEFEQLNQSETKRNRLITNYKINSNFSEVLIKFTEMNMIDSNKNQFDDILDVYLELKFKKIELPLVFRLGKPRILVERNLKGQTYFEKENIVHDFVPYFTIKGKNLSFYYNKYSKESFNILKKIKRKKIKNKKPVWVIGEKAYKAQDTGYHFFKYLRENCPEIDAYYVIDKEAKEYHNVAHIGNVLNYKSKEHFEKMVLADYICTSHHAEHIFPNRSRKMEKAITAKKVFLQHGVMGTKNLSTYYAKILKGFNTDLFVTSSEREKEIVVDDLGYSKKEVLVTGLSRFDTLLKKDIKKEKQILLIPSWREWITDVDKLLKSQYLIKMNELMKKLDEMDLKGYQVVFCLHPNMQPFLDYFEIPTSDTFKVISQGDRDVQDLMKESAIMITDYSSVGFDFSFLHRPVLYYQYDRERFLGKYPSHLDLDNELPGYITDSVYKLCAKLMVYIENDGENDQEYIERSRRFFNLNDLNSSKRIYEQVKQHKFTLKEKLDSALEQEIIFVALKNKFRKSKMYYTVMKLLYKIWKIILPPIKNLILFESNVGKSVADSPKVIYQELITQNKPYQFVWVSNNKYNESLTKDTKVIKRLSWQYYYYLARANFWVNNQNFPTYIKKPKRTTYLQTWHGTPLKKMQNDIEVITGRDATYLTRVNQAVSNWDYLVSPSEYASKSFRSAFHFKKEILEYGYPRNDLFHQPEEIAKRLPVIKERLGLENEKRKIVLYAPTFRDDELHNGRARFNLKIDLEDFYNKLSTDYLLLIKSHTIVSNSISIPEEYTDSIMNVSDYNDIQELYLVADICITDYSSVMFDFANTKKTLLFFTYDLEHYRENLRGFYMDFEEEAPGPLCLTSDELINAISNIKEVSQIYQNKYTAFYNKYCGLEDGRSAEKVVKKVFE